MACDTALKSPTLGKYVFWNFSFEELIYKNFSAFEFENIQKIQLSFFNIILPNMVFTGVKLLGVNIT